METETLIEDWFKRNYKCFKSYFNRFLSKLVLSEYTKFNEITDSFSFF